MNIFIIKADLEDADSLAAIQKQAFERLYLVYHDEANPYLRGSDEMKRRIESDTWDAYKILVDNNLCGGIAVIDKGNDEYYLSRLYILPELQGKGIGRKAIELCEKKYPAAKKWVLDFPADQIANKKCYEYSGYFDTGLRNVKSDKLTLAVYEKIINGISEIRQTQLDQALEVVQKSFATVAEEFGLTKQNSPNHTSFIAAEKLQNNFNWGWHMFGLYDSGLLVGYVSLSKEDEMSFELHNLAVLPEYRNKGYGKQLLDFCKEFVRKLGGSKITIGIIEEHTVLKNWYITNGFIHTGTKKFNHLPFVAGYMEWEDDICLVQ